MRKHSVLQILPFLEHKIGGDLFSHPHEWPPDMLRFSSILCTVFDMRIDRSIREKLDNNNHSVFSLNYHLILVIKYRRKVITDESSNFLKEVFLRICPDYKIGLKEWGHDKDHVHILFKAQPDTSLSRFINIYKSASSRLVKNRFPEIRQLLWKENFWSKSYCLISAGGASLEVLKEYIEKQGMD